VERICFLAIDPIDLDMIELRTPRGLPVNVPETETEDPSPKFAFDELNSFENYYDENGYAIIKNLFSPDNCCTRRTIRVGS